MASLSRVTEAKRRAKLCKAGRKRKNKMGKKSTLSKVEMFAAVDAPKS